MQLSIKQILAVGALAAASTSAFATATVPGGGVVGTYSATTPTGDNGGLVFSLFSKNSDTAFSLNNYLGVSLNNVIPTEMADGGMTLTWHLEGLNNIPASGPGAVALSDLVWGVTASDSGSTTNSTAGDIRLASTVNLAGLTDLTNGTIGVVTDHWDGVTGANNLNSSPVDFTTLAGSPTDLQQAFNTDDGVTGFSWTGGVGEALGMYLYTESGGRGTANNNANATAYAGTWAFNLGNSTLTYSVAPVSSVPLPAAFWLLLSGVGGLSVIGRRKDKSASVAV